MPGRQLARRERICYEKNKQRYIDRKRIDYQHKDRERHFVVGQEPIYIEHELCVPK